MLYPIIRRVRRPLLPLESLPTAKPLQPPQGAEQTQVVPAAGDPTAPEIVPPVEQPASAPVTQQEVRDLSPEPSKEPVPPPAAVAELPLVSALQPETKPVTSTKPKRAKATEEKSRKTVEPGAQA